MVFHKIESPNTVVIPTKRGGGELVSIEYLPFSKIPFVTIRCLSLSASPHDAQMILYWLGDLMSLNLVTSAINSEPPILPKRKPNPLTPQMGERQCLYKLRFAPMTSLKLTFT